MNIDQILNFRRGLTFNSYSRLILDPLRRPDKLLLLLQRTLRVSPGNHTFGLSSFLPLLFILKSVMAPPFLHQVEFKKGFPIQERPTKTFALLALAQHQPPELSSAESKFAEGSGTRPPSSPAQNVLFSENGARS